MKPFKSKVSQTTTCNKEYKIVTNDKFLPYWDEGKFYHKPKGRKKYKSRELLQYQVRMYKSWKHNRKKQYK
jgi:hypothetical protein